MDGRRLPWAPDERLDRERAVGLGVEHVAQVLLLIAVPLFIRENAGRGKVTLELEGHESCGLGPVCVPAYGASNRGHELSQLRPGRLARSSPCDRHISLDGESAPD